MKITQEHFDILKRKIEDVLAKNPNVVADYETGNFPNASKVKHLQKRFNWDTYWACGINSLVCKWNYLSDSHIDTVLRRICPKVTRRY